VRKLSGCVTVVVVVMVGQASPIHVLAKYQSREKQKSGEAMGLDRGTSGRNEGGAHTGHSLSSPYLQRQATSKDKGRTRIMQRSQRVCFVARGVAESDGSKQPSDIMPVSSLAKGAAQWPAHKAGVP
jgi:hypothetical protein